MFGEVRQLNTTELTIFRYNRLLKDTEEKE